MLDNLFMVNYYGFVQQYWTAKYNSSTTNIEVMFTQAALTALGTQVEQDDTAANRALFDTESTTQAEYVSARKGARAGVVSDEELATALTAYQAARTARRSAIPNSAALVDAINVKAGEVFDTFQHQYDVIWKQCTEINKTTGAREIIPGCEAEIEKYRQYLVYAQTLRDWASDFEEKLSVYLEATETELDQIDDTGQLPTTYQDIINASNYTFDGTYSDEIGHISPNGKLYGAMQMAQKIEHLIWWNPPNWEKIPEEIDQAASADLLPANVAAGHVWRIPTTFDPNTGEQRYDYYRSTGTGWAKMTQFWDIDGLAKLPNAGHNIGDYHKLIERNVPIFWDGYQDRRIAFSALHLDLPDMFLPPGFIAQNSADIDGLITGLSDTNDLITTTAGEINGRIDNEIEALSQSLADISDQVAEFSSSGEITLAEAQNLKIAQIQLSSDADSLEEIADLFEITTEKTAFHEAVAALEAVLSLWINLPDSAYPKAITTEERSAIDSAFQSVQATRSTLEMAINAARTNGVQASLDEFREYTDNQFEQVSGNISSLNTVFGQYASDNFISLAESNSLKNSLIQLQAESQDIIDLANALGITDEVPAYAGALSDLAEEMDQWIDQLAYPKEITAIQRTNINTLFGNVQTAKTTLQNAVSAKLNSNTQTALTDYLDGEIETLNAAISELGGDISGYLGDGFITFVEASGLEIALSQVTAESTALLSEADTLDITTEATAYSTALSNLQDSLDQWLGRSDYPVAIGDGQRAIISALFETVQATKTALINKVSTTLQTNAISTAQVYADGQITTVTSQINTLDNDLTILSGDFSDAFSDEYVSSIEANKLAQDLAAIQATSTKLLATATALSITTEATDYSTALTNLESGLSSFIGQASYPVAITVNQRNNITSLFCAARDKESILTAKIIAVTQANAITSANQYTAGQISAINSNISALNATLEYLGENVSGLEMEISSAQAATLESALGAYQDASTDLIATATDLGITAELADYEASLETLADTLEPYIDQAEYPITITILEQTAITSAFNDIVAKQTQLQIKIIEAQQTQAIESLSSSVDSRFETVNANIENTTDAIEVITTDINNLSSDGQITLSEANTYASDLGQLQARSTSLQTTATSLGITTEVTAYSNALTSLANGLAQWINQASYPIPITTQQRVAIADLLAAVQTSEATLVSKIFAIEATAAREYTDDQFDELNTDLTNLAGDVEKYADDGFVTLAESQALQADLSETIADSAAIMEIAEDLGITTPLTEFVASINGLIDSFDCWLDPFTLGSDLPLSSPIRLSETHIDTNDYPIAVDPTDRENIKQAFVVAQRDRVILQHAIDSALTDGVQEEVTTYIDDQVNELSDSIDAFDASLTNYFNDGVITSIEAAGLNIQLINLVSESGDIISAANLVGITTEKDSFANAVSSLQSILQPFVAQATYPIQLSQQQRGVITAAFQTAQNAKSVLINAVKDKQVAGVQIDLDSFRDTVTGEFEDVNSALSGLNTEITNFSSDEFITAAEAQALKLQWAQVDSESENILDAAEACDVTTQATAYSSALGALETALDSWIDQASYPIAITSNQRTTIQTAFELVQSTKVALQNAITAKLDADSASSVSSAINEYIDGQLETIGENISDIQDTVDRINDSGAITRAESEALKTSLNELVSESTAIITDATSYGISTEKTAFQNAITALQSALAAWIDQASYPIDITAEQRTATQTAFENVQSTKSALISAIRASQSQSFVDGINVVRDDLVDAFREADIALDENWTQAVTNAKVVWESPTAIGLDTQQIGKIGAVWVNGELVVDDETGADAITVHNTDPVINYSASTGLLSTLSVVADTEYYIYLANHVSSAFYTGGRDARGKLFLSLTPDINGYLGLAAPATNARIVGQISTDSAGLFLREIDISWIARQASITDTMREVCDFSLRFVDENSIALQLVDGLKGQIYVGGHLLVYGDNVTVTRTMHRITWADDTAALDQTAISANTRYYIYVLDDNMSWNFNAINPATNLPWRESDENSSGNYISTLDKRQDLVLCTTDQQHMVLSQVYPGYCARYMGSVMTDANGLFIYSSDISAIRGLQLDPTYLSGLAEISIQDISSSSFKIIRKRGTSGILMVGNVGVQCYDSDDPRVHTATLNDSVYTYSEVDPDEPFTDTGNTVSYYIGATIYLYMLNDRSVWGDQVNGLIFCTNAPVGGYLSTNYPGNSARWIGTVQPAPGQLGVELVTNGNFDNSNDWSGSPGWGWSQENLNVYHNVGNTTPLAQISMSVSEGATYQIKFTVSGVGAGSITPHLGGVAGTAITSGGSFTQYIQATNTTVLSFVPTSDFVGAIDTVSAMQVTSATFTGSYIRDSIAQAVPTIDNTITGPNILWDSQKIMQVINDALGMSAVAAIFNAQKTSGLNVRLGYVNTTTIRLIPVSGQDSTVVFPSLGTKVVPASGLTLTVSGAPNTRYYVYLLEAPDTPMMMSTTPPDSIFNRLETLGSGAIQVGDICLTSQNAMTGNHNVCSSHYENSSFSPISVTSNNQNAILAGAVLSRNCSASAELAMASVTVRIVYRSVFCTGYPYQTVDRVINSNGGTTTVGTYIPVPNLWCNCAVTVKATWALSDLTSLEGIMTTVGLYTDNLSVTNNSEASISSYAVVGRSGSITINRRSNF